MEIKFLEIRDSATCIPVMAIRMQSNNPLELAYLRRCGYPQDGQASIGVFCLSDLRGTNYLYEWGSLKFGPRTMPNAHHYIEQNWAGLKSGDVVDVRVILGETKVPAAPEIWDNRP